MGSVHVGSVGTRAGHVARTAFAVTLTLLAALLELTLARRALLGGVLVDAFRFFATSVLTLLLLGVLPRTWRSVARRDPRPAAPPVPAERAPLDHLTLSGHDAHRHRVDGDALSGEMIAAGPSFP